VSALCVYAFVDEKPRRAPGRGLGGEALLVVGESKAFAIAGEMTAPLSPDEHSLLRYDAVVRRLASSVASILPARFGSTAESREQLEALVVARRQDLAKAFEVVRGREQMTLRVFDSRTAPNDGGDSAMGGAAGPGTRHLVARARAQRDAVAGVAAVRSALLPIVRAEAIEMHSAPPLAATVFHLVDHADVEKWQRLVQTTPIPRGVRLHATGPFPPWAFAPRLLA
jgi:gas vesicle protein GvpL/GvpF